jgi:hypothetical protein
MSTMDCTSGGADARAGAKRPFRACLLLAGLAFVLSVVLIFPPFGQSQAPKGEASPSQLKAATRSSLDRALRLIAQAQESFAEVDDYTCVVVKREAVGDQLLPENVIAMKFRKEPFSVHMKWQQPKALAGQEACYVAGKNNGMMRAKGAGLLGAVGFVNLDPKDPRTKKYSRHCITEAGIGCLIERYAERWGKERELNHTKVRIAEYEFNKCKCVRVETLHPGSKPGDFYSFRNIIYFDKETHLPIRSELYDWPKEGGKPDGDLMECFSFTDLKLNVGLEDDDFKY